MQFLLSKSIYIVFEFGKKLGKSALAKNTCFDHLNFPDDRATVFFTVVSHLCFFLHSTLSNEQALEILLFPPSVGIYLLKM